MQRLVTLVVLLLASCGASEQLGSETSDIENGSAWSPWTETTETWTRNVVGIGIAPNSMCTGTLLDYEWVLTARHCVATATASDIDVTHKLADGSTETAWGTEVFLAPGTDVDTALIRLSSPLHPDRALPLYSGTTASLVGQSVFCAGYGAIAIGPACSASAPSCPAGQSCDTEAKLCLQGDNGLLRTARFKIITDTVDPTNWYQLKVPNAAGQIELWGDSGSSCWSDADGGLTGTLSGGDGYTISHQTAIPAARDWIESLIEPTVVSIANKSAIGCHVSNNRAVLADDGSVVGAGYDLSNVICPIERPIQPIVTNYVSVPDVWVIDQDPSAAICCNVQALGSTGIMTANELACTTGASSAVQRLTPSSLFDGKTFDSFSLACTLPAPHDGAKSSIKGYRVETRLR